VAASRILQVEEGRSIIRVGRSRAGEVSGLVAPAAPLVGRDADVSALAAVLAQAGEGVGSMVLVSGEAGIGKTRLCAELGRLHRRRGGRVLLGRAAAQEASIPFAAVADALRGARRAEPAVWAAARARAEVLWAVAPELASGAGGPEQSADRPVLFEALLDAVDEAAGDGTALWVLDDLHWADDSTWEFVRYAARRVADLALVLAVTYREEEIGPAHPWWPGLVQLKREPSVLCLPLGRLSAADGERIARAVGPALPEATVAAIVERGAGTPLLVEELASLAARPGDLPLVPDIVRATVRERAGRLDPAGRALLEVAAVAGLEVEAGLLASVVSEGRPGDLVSAGLLDQEDEERFRFRHALLHEAVYQEIPAERRRALHEQIAAAIAASGSYPAERAAAHLERAGRPEAALSQLETAAGEANRAGQVGRSATLRLSSFQLAGRHRSLAGQRARLEEAATRGLFGAGRWSELDPLIRGAWSRRGALPPADRTQLAAVFSAHQFWTGSAGQAFAVAKGELATLEECGGLDEGGALLREAALIAWYTGDGAAARVYVDRALDVARRTSDMDLDIRARRLEIFIAYGEQREPQAAIARMRENAAQARAHGLVVHEGWALLYLSFITGRLSDVEAARELSQQAGAWSWMFALREGTLQLMEGRREASEAIFNQIRHELRLGIPTMAAWVDAKEACLYLHRGDLDEARKLLEGPSAASEASSCGLIGAEWSAALGWLAWEEGNLPEVCTHLARAGADKVMETYNTISAGPAYLALRVDALLRLGRFDEAAAAISGFEAFNLGYERFMAAALAAAQFRLDPTLQQAEAAETATTPWPWLHALAGCWRGEFLQDAGAAEGARRQFGAIGAHLGVRRAEAVLRRLGARLPRRERGADTLSPREIEVADLVAEGLSNPAIARRLYVSRTTVASHVGHILVKLGFSSRAQIAAWVAQRRALAP
jgi:DNA-binding CsgD family transcriptional regulator